MIFFIDKISGATFHDRINTIYQFIKPFLDKKCLFLRNMEPLKSTKKRDNIQQMNSFLPYST